MTLTKCSECPVQMGEAGVGQCAAILCIWGGLGHKQLGFRFECPILHNLPGGPRTKIRLSDLDSSQATVATEVSASRHSSCLV